MPTSTSTPTVRSSGSGSAVGKARPATLRGPAFDPKLADRLMERLTAAVQQQASSAENAVQGAAPVDTGKLRDSVKTKVRQKKRKILITITATAKNKQGQHYSGFVENATNFAHEALEAQLPAILGAVAGTMADLIEEANRSNPL